MPRLFQLVYVSTALVDFNDEQLAAMLRKALIRNAALAITGMLIYARGNFLQVLEGPRAEVQALYRRIERDARHHNLVLLLEKEVEDRYFPVWSMGFESRNRDFVADIPGYVDLKKLSRQDLESTAHSLIRSFMEHMAEKA